MKTVLIAEDNDLLADLWSRALRNSCNVVVARDGEEALHMATQNKPDLILMDVMMPKIDGLEACRRIQGVYASPPPVMFISCLARSADMAEANKMRAHDFLVKGKFSVQSLVERVSRILYSPRPI
jgi:CheY-like chemotaxis protein